MSLTRLTFTYAGGPQVFSTNFALGVLEADHIFVSVDGNVDGQGNQVFSNFTYDENTGNVTITDTLTIGDTGIIARIVPIESLITSFEEGGADVTRRNLDRMAKQVLMSAQQIRDQSDADTQRIDQFLDEVVDEVAELTQDAQNAASNSVQSALAAQGAALDASTSKQEAQDAAAMAQAAHKGRQYTTRAEFVADTDYVNGDDTPQEGTVATAGGLQYIRSAGATALPQLAGWLPFNAATPKHFDAVGDGITDDTAALIAAISSGLPLYWGSGIYRHTTPLSQSVAKVDWSGNGAVILYDGAHAREAVAITCGIGQDHKVCGIEFDANQKANVAVKFIAATVDQPITEWPNLFGSDLVARNAYRADRTFLDGDGMVVNGGFNRAEIDRVSVYDCFMAVGAEVVGSQGIFGITFGSNGSRRARHITLKNYHIENVWSEDATYKNDQDGVRIFQETAERTSSSYVLQGVIKNVANRAIKLHSGVNAVVDVLYRELDAAVIPQSGTFSNPDIDSQQCPATITNCRFHYDGAWHGSLIQNYTERPGLFRYGGTVVNGITGRFVNAAGSDIVVVRMTGEAGLSATKHIGTVSNIAIDGPVRSFLSVLIRGTEGTNNVSLVNAVGEVRTNAVEAFSETARLRVTAVNLHNTNPAAPVPLGANFDTGDRELTVLGYYGFTTTGAAVSFGGAKSLVTDTVTAVSALNGPTFDPNRVGNTRIGFKVPSTVGVSENDVILLLQDTTTTQSHASGVVHLYRGTAIAAGVSTLRFAISKDASSGALAGHCAFDGPAVKAAQLVLCEFEGTPRLGIRLSGGGAATALAEAFFSGNYLSAQPMALVSASSTTNIEPFVQRSGFEPVSELLQPVRIPSYVVASLPNASIFARCQVWVSDEVGGAQPAYSDGVNWRRFSDGEIVS